jgi:hypothetical protein
MKNQRTYIPTTLVEPYLVIYDILYYGHYSIGNCAGSYLSCTECLTLFIVLAGSRY